MSTEQRPAHSPLGASGAERWMACPGSVALLKELQFPETDEPEYRTLGTSAHEAACKLLIDKTEPWELIGQTFGAHLFDQDMCDAVTMYVDECRRIMQENPDGQEFIEFKIDAPEFHHDFYGTTDWSYVAQKTLFVRDYKHGEGIAVDVEWNPQIMYYAWGLLRQFPGVDRVSLGIVQPRAFHGDGPIRVWEVEADQIRGWATDTLKPAMDRTSLDNSLDAGNWCRFCPAKLVCPLMHSLFGAAMQADPKALPQLSDEALGRSYHYLAAVKSFIKAMEAETLRRLTIGHLVPHTKLVQQKTNRVWKEGAVAALLNSLGKDAYTTPEIKSPPQIEALGQVAKELVKEWAYKPDGGLTVAGEDDRRHAVAVKSVQDTFANAAAAIDNPASGG